MISPKLRDRRSSSVGRRRRRVNRPGVILLGVLALCGIAFVRMVEEQDEAGLAPAQPEARAVDMAGLGEQDEEDGVLEARDDRQDLVLGGTSASGSASSSSFSSSLSSEGAAERNVDSSLVQFVRQSKAAGSAADSPVVLTYSSFNYRFILMNWILSLKRVKVDSYAIVCLDNLLANFLKARGISCFSVLNYNNARSGETKKDDAQLKVKQVTQKLASLWVLRMTHLVELLQAGISVIFSDSDAIWTSNAIESGLLSKRTGDLVFSRGQFPFDLHERWGATACMGLAYFASTSRVLEFVQLARAEAITANDDQIGVNRALFKSYGLNPSGVFGKKLDLFSSHDDVAPGSEDLPRLVLAAHSKVPRFCKRLSKQNWNQDVLVAHCHAKDGVVAKTNKNAANSKSRNAIMIKYDLWCPGATQSPAGPKKFAAWLQAKAANCEFIRFQNHHK